MKNILGVLSLIMALTSFGQGYAEGDNVVGLGVGLGNTFISPGASTKVPPLQLYYEAGITDHLSVGGVLGFTSTSASVTQFGYSYKYNYNYTLIGLRGAYHFGYLLGTVDNFDLYGCLTMGYVILGSKRESSAGAPNYSNTVNNGGFHIGVYAGMRYYFNESIGVFGELGYNISVVQVGVAFKL